MNAKSDKKIKITKNQLIAYLISVQTSYSSGIDQQLNKEYDELLEKIQKSYPDIVEQSKQCVGEHRDAQIDNESFQEMLAVRVKVDFKDCIRNCDMNHNEITQSIKAYFEFTNELCKTKAQQFDLGLETQKLAQQLFWYSPTKEQWEKCITSDFIYQSINEYIEEKKALFLFCDQIEKIGEEGMLLAKHLKNELEKKQAEEKNLNTAISLTEDLSACEKMSLDAYHEHMTEMQPKYDAFYAACNASSNEKDQEYGRLIACGKEEIDQCMSNIEDLLELSTDLNEYCKNALKIPEMDEKIIGRKNRKIFEEEVQKLNSTIKAKDCKAMDYSYNIYSAVKNVELSYTAAQKFIKNDKTIGIKMQRFFEAIKCSYMRLISTTEDRSGKRELEEVAWKNYKKPQQLSDKLQNEIKKIKQDLGKAQKV